MKARFIELVPLLPHPVALLGAALTGKFLVRTDVTLPEAFVYISLAIVIAGHWAFDAWLKVQTAKSTHSVDEELKKDVADLKTKINALSVREAFRA